MAEVKGLVAATECFLWNEPDDEEPLFFFTDNRAAIRVATGAKTPWWCVKEAKLLRTLIEDIAQARRVVCFWVPGHGDVVGNELADRLAKRGATGILSDGEATLDDDYGIPAEELVSMNVLGDRRSPEMVCLRTLLKKRARPRPARALSEVMWWQTERGGSEDAPT